jgi:hypothetical protein
MRLEPRLDERLHPHEVGDHLASRVSAEQLGHHVSYGPGRGTIGHLDVDARATILRLETDHPMLLDD